MGKNKLVPSRDDLIQCLLATRGQSEGTTADAILSMLAAAPAVQEPVAHTFYILHDKTEGWIKKHVDDGCLAIFDREEDAQRAKRRHPGTGYKRIVYYIAPQQPQPPAAKERNYE